MRSRRLLTLGCGAALALACGSEPGLQLGQARSAIIRGEPTGATQESVVRVFGDPPPGVQETARACTGTLIAPNLVLTALHCVSPITGDGQFSCTIDGELENPPAGTLGTPFAADHIAVTVGPDFKPEPDARGAQLLHTRSTAICTNDLALLVLDRSLDVPIAPVRIDSRVQVSEPVTVAGYGLTTFPATSGELAMRRWRGGLRVLAVEQEGREKARPRTFSLGESVCMGDSGGPAFSDQGAVLGVYSTNVAGCEGSAARNFFTMISEFRPLILEAFAVAGAAPWLEGQPAPGTVVDAGAPEPTLDSGSLVPLDSTPPQLEDPPPPGKRVDSGFCSTSPITPGGTGGIPLLATLLLGLGAARWRRTRVGLRTSQEPGAPTHTRGPGSLLVMPEWRRPAERRGVGRSRRTRR